MVLAVIALTFTSCDGEEDVVPTITVTPATTNVYAPGNVVTYAVAVATVNKELKMFSVTATSASAITAPTITATAGMFTNATGTFAGDLTEAAFTYSFTVGALTAATEVGVTFTVEDDKATNDDVKTFTVGTGAPAVTEYASRVSTGDYSSLTTANGFDVETGTAVAANQGEDFVIVYNGTTKNIICSPNSTQLSTLYGYNSKTYNNNTVTKLQKLSGVDYASVDAAYVDAMTVTPVSSGYTQVIAGDVIAFETATGVKGVTKIVSVTSTKGVAPVTYSVKVQASAGK